MSAPAELLPDVMTEEGTIATDRLAKVLHITKKDRVVRAAVDDGWISEDAYTRTRPVTADL